MGKKHSGNQSNQVANTMVTLLIEKNLKIFRKFR
jgi:hypothetical protein